MVGTGDYQRIAKFLNRVEQGEIVNEVSKMKILVEKISDNNPLIGRRSYNFAPEVD